MIEAGTFRPDLFFRINVFPISIPPLRKRPEDIPILARTILADTAKRLGLKVPSIGSEAMANLTAVSWPGNVRELANVLERGLIMSSGRELKISGLPVGLATKVEPEAAEQPQTFDDGARRTIQRALEACGGKIYGRRGAAERLGIPPSTLQGKMRRLGIQSKTERNSK
jgi:DNA-binding NtrC family response regulator